jgi:hypothetical protein
MPCPACNIPEEGAASRLPANFKAEVNKDGWRNWKGPALTDPSRTQNYFGASLFLEGSPPGPSLEIGGVFGEPLGLSCSERRVLIPVVVPDAPWRIAELLVLLPMLGRMSASGIVAAPPAPGPCAAAMPVEPRTAAAINVNNTRLFFIWNSPFRRWVDNRQRDFMFLKHIRVDGRLHSRCRLALAIVKWTIQTSGDPRP